MKKIITSFGLLLVTTIAFGQQIGDGLAPGINDYTIPRTSGVYSGLDAIGGIPDLTHSWSHLFLIRHANSNNNHQLQLASSFTQNDRLFFRKIAADLNPSNPSWIELATRGANTFAGNQLFNGSVKIQTANGDYNENLRLLPSTTGDFSSIALGAVPGDSGTGIGQWTMIRYPASSNYMFSLRYNTTDYLNILNNGNVGIGTTAPNTKLTVVGNSATQLVSSLIGGVVSQNFKYTALSIGESVSAGSSSNIGYMSHQTDKSLSGLYLTNYGDSEHNASLFVKVGGNVGIGVTNPQNKLDVKGTIRSQEVKVTLDGWSDFVFKKEYDLPTLAEVEKHIKEKGHLENIPNEEEVLKNGINLGEMNAKLLQKIEELTLYMIDMKKENDQMKKRLVKLENK
ncbi:hypothetical protein [Flavobacterium sp. T12S277]|uniref:hypothetical protein n=1 Tax=Flavobacterium sp. T12S277 TaxID=3402752 RepID=UPI003ADD14C1